MRLILKLQVIESKKQKNKSLYFRRDYEIHNTNRTENQEE